MIGCPYKSISNAGAKSRADCYCVEGYYGSLGAPSTTCKLKPPGMNCSFSTNCTCPIGWTSTYTVIGDYTAQKCLSTCQVGQYTEVDEHMNKIRCVNCPRNFYTNHKEATRASECTPCPSGFVTQQDGATSEDYCSCPLVVDTAGACVPCSETSYLDPVTRTCKPCPTGMVSPMGGGVGMNSCLCPLGKRSILHPTQGMTCVPCSVGTFSTTYAATCTPCKQGMTTTEVGATSPSACKCMQPGTTYYAGKCRPH